jgi:Gpi18-like mannosyltransferase
MTLYENYTADIWGAPFAALCCAAFVILCLLTLKKMPQSGAKPAFKKIIIISFALSFVMRFLFGLTFEGHSDVSFFRYWADILTRDPFTFYDSADNNYLPLYLYLLMLQGYVFKLFNIPIGSDAFVVVFKLPLILCDLATAYVIYKIIRIFAGERKAFLFCLLYLFNPAAILLSSFWGQVDAFTALLTVLCVHFLLKEKYIAAFITIGLGMAFKLQFAFILPVAGIYVTLKAVKYIKNKQYRNFKNMVWGAAAMLGVYAAAVLPLTLSYMLKGRYPILFDIYFSGQINMYNYYTVNAFNLYGALRLNWVCLPQSFYGIMSFDLFNYIIIAVICLVSIYLFVLSKDKNTLYLLSAFIICAVFTFSTKMHERYMFAALAPLLIAAAILKDNRLYFCFGGFTLLNFLNCGVLLFKRPELRYYDYGGDPFFVVCSVLWVLLFIYFAYVTASVCVKSGKRKTDDKVGDNGREGTAPSEAD